MVPDFFKEFPAEPDEVSASNVIARMIDGLGFRLYWAIYGLTEEDCEYTVCEGADSIYKILWHILGLVNWVYMHVYDHQMKRPESIVDQGIETLKALESLRAEFLRMSDEELQQKQLQDMPFWSFVNMPFADALHHVGQVAILRRAAGNPSKQAEYFKKKKQTQPTLNQP